MDSALASAGARAGLSPPPGRMEAALAVVAASTFGLAARLLVHDRFRALISIAALGVAVLLVVLLRGIMDGTVAQSTTYVDHVGADVFIAQEGVTNMSLSSSSLPASSVPVARKVPGVRTAAGVIRLEVVAHAGPRLKPAQLLGYETAAGGLGGPWDLASGRVPATRGEAVLDHVLARELSLDLGEAVTVAGQDFRVVGLSRGTAAIAGKVLFIDLADAQDLLQLQGIVSFILIEITPGSDVAAVVGALKAELPGVTALTREELSENDRDVLAGLFVAPVDIMSTVGYIVGLAIVGLTMYTTTAERMHDFGVLKAIGAGNGILVGTVFTQAVVLAVLGFVAGVAGAVAAGPAVMRFVPDVGVAINFRASLGVAGLVIAMALVGSLLPVVRIMRVDPLVVFRR